MSGHNLRTSLIWAKSAAKVCLIGGVQGEEVVGADTDDPRRPKVASVRVRSDRVVEVNVRRLVDLDDIEWLNAEVSAALRRAGSGAVICADYRAASPVPAKIARVWARGMRKANSEILRSGLLVDPANTMFNLQMERIVRCAINPERRLFTDLDELNDWIGGVLSEPEREALGHLFSSSS